MSDYDPDRPVYTEVENTRAMLEAKLEYARKLLRRTKQLRATRMNPESVVGIIVAELEDDIAWNSAACEKEPNE
jgi:hypothetical protein